MHVQMLSFRLMTGGNRVAADRFVSVLELAMGDYPGLVESRWIPGETPVAINVWENAAALEGFRHSELFARIMLCPKVESVEERAFEVVRSGPAQFRDEEPIAFGQAA